MTSEYVQEQGAVTTKVIGVGPDGAGLVRRMESWGLPCVGAFVLPPGAEDEARRGLRFDGGDYRITRELEGIERLYLVVGSSWTARRPWKGRWRWRWTDCGPVACWSTGIRIPDADSQDAGRYAYGTASFAHAVEENAWRLLSQLASAAR